MSNSNSGTGFGGLLTIVFVVLKLTKIIDWAWIWVVSPLWIGVLLAIILYCTVACTERKRKKALEGLLKRRLFDE
jgi:hypothetical protein